MKMQELTIQFRYHYHFEDHLEDAVEGSDLQVKVRVSLVRLLLTVHTVTHVKMLLSPGTPPHNLSPESDPFCAN